MDWKAIAGAILPPLGWWTAAVLFASLADFPGVVCLTPLGWLVGMFAGQRVVTLSQTLDPDRRLFEAAVAGGLAGVYVAFLAAVVVQYGIATVLESVSPLFSSVFAFLILGVTGAVVSAALGVIFGRLRLLKSGN